MNCYIKGQIVLTALLLVLTGGTLLESPVKREYSFKKSAQEAESLLATGAALYFFKEDLYGLELIPTLNKSSAWSLYMYQNQVLKKYCQGASLRAALTVAPGIGEKTVEKILPYLSVEADVCFVRRRDLLESSVVRSNKRE